MVYQQYLPDELLKTVYYEGIDSGKYERALMERNKAIKKVLRK